MFRNVSICFDLFRFVSICCGFLRLFAVWSGLLRFVIRAPVLPTPAISEKVSKGQHFR